MIRHIRSSRERFQNYLTSLRARESGEDIENQDAQASAKYEARRSRKHRQRSTWQLVKQFLELLRGHYLAILFALFTVTIATLLGLLPPAATKFLVDYVLTDQPVPEVSFWSSWLPESRWDRLVLITSLVVIISFVKSVVHIIGRWEATRTVKRVQMSLRKRVLSHAIRLPLSRVHELKSGGIASILREDAGSVGDLLFGMLYNPWRAVTQLIGSLIILTFVDWRLLLGAIILLPLIYLTHRTWIRRIRPRYRDVRQRRTEIDSRATETFGGMRVVRAFGRQRSETTRIIKETHLMGRQELNVWWWMRIIEIVWETMIPIATAALMLYGGWQVIEGTLTTGDLMMFLVYLLMLLEPLAVLAESAAALQNSLSGLDRILDLLEEQQEFASSTSTKAKTLQSMRGEIEFRNVSFRYSEDSPWALKEINLQIHAGETIALVGPSGAGKTTLCNLVARFYDPTDGEILIDGEPLTQWDVEQYRRMLGVVEQDVFLFDGTVSENIAYANRNCSTEEIYRAAQVAHADEFISSLPDGYETLIGERGVKLSGGQRQRLAIARAVLAAPRILVLDEATSNLDSESEQFIQQSFRDLMHDRTSLVIAHRLSTIRDADRIVVIEDGQIREIGPHDELIQLDGRYREMLAVQLGRNPEFIGSEV